MTEEQPIFWGKYNGSGVTIRARLYESVERLRNGPAVAIEIFDQDKREFLPRPTEEVETIARERGANIIATVEKTSKFPGAQHIKGQYLFFRTSSPESISSYLERISASSTRPQGTTLQYETTWGRYDFDPEGLPREKFTVTLEDTEQSIPRGQLEKLGTLTGHIKQGRRYKRRKHKEVEQYARVTFSGPVLIVPSSNQKPTHSSFTFYKLQNRTESGPN